METSGLEPEITIRKIAVLPIKLYPRKKTLLKKNYIFFYPKNELNVHDIISVKLKFTLSTNSSTRIKTKIQTNNVFLSVKARVSRTLISAVMSSLLYQLSYNLDN